jgi:probable rRNA maturation factor
MECQVSVHIDEPFQARIDSHWLRRVAEETLTREGVSSAVELGLAITDSETIRQLNRSYRGRDESTDVLSFAFNEEPSSGATPFFTPPNGLLHLGEVVLCYPQAVLQAEEHRHPVERELALLVIHGILHLLGYDDDKPAPRRRMKAREEEILEGVMA